MRYRLTGQYRALGVSALVLALGLDPPPTLNRVLPTLTPPSSSVSTLELPDVG